MSDNRKTHGRKIMFKKQSREVHPLVLNNRKTQTRKTTKRCKILHRKIQGVIDNYCSVKSLHSVEINRGSFCNETMLNLRYFMNKYNGGKQVTTM